MNKKSDTTDDWQGYPRFLAVMNRFLGIPALIAAIPPIPYFIILGAGWLWPILFGVFAAVAAVNIITILALVVQKKASRTAKSVGLLVISLLYLAWLVLIIKTAMQF